MMMWQRRDEMMLGQRVAAKNRKQNEIGMQDCMEILHQFDRLQEDARRACDGSKNSNSIVEAKESYRRDLPSKYHQA